MKTITLITFIIIFWSHTFLFGQAKSSSNYLNCNVYLIEFDNKNKQEERILYKEIEFYNNQKQKIVKELRLNAVEKLKYKIVKYDSLGREIKEIYTFGNNDIAMYSTKTYNSGGKVDTIKYFSETDSLKGIMIFEYDNFNNLLRTITKGNTLFSDGLHSWGEYVLGDCEYFYKYDLYGKIIERTLYCDETNYINKAIYNQAGLIDTLLSYDRLGVYNKSVYRYDINGNILKEIWYDRVFESGNSIQYKERFCENYRYDIYGNEVFYSRVTEHSEIAKIIKKYTYDDSGNVLKIESYGGINSLDTISPSVIYIYDYE